MTQAIQPASLFFPIEDEDYSKKDFIEIQKLIIRMAAGTFKQVSEPKKGFETLSNICELHANITDLSNILLVVDDHHSKRNHLYLWHQLENRLREDLCEVIIKNSAPFEERTKAQEELGKIFAETLMKKDELERMKKETAFYVTTVTPRIESILKKCYQVIQTLDQSSPCIKDLKPDTKELLLKFK